MMIIFVFVPDHVIDRMIAVDASEIHLSFHQLRLGSVCPILYREFCTIPPLVGPWDEAWHLDFRLLELTASCEVDGSGFPWWWTNGGGAFFGGRFERWVIMELFFGISSVLFLKCFLNKDGDFLFFYPSFRSDHWAIP